MKSKSKSKKFEISVCILNIILIIVMIGYLFHAFAGKKEVATSNADTVKVDDTEFSFDEANDAMADVYTTLIKGTNVNISNDKQMHFGTDGTFSGFFDENSTDVEGYSYEVWGITNDADQNGAVAIVNIYNQDRSQYVQYHLVYGGNSDEPELLLQYPGSGKTYALEF